jgi:hypothetical protein
MYLQMEKQILLRIDALNYKPFNILSLQNWIIVLILNPNADTRPFSSIPILYLLYFFTHS